MNQATQPTAPAAHETGASRASYERARVLADRLVAQLTTLPTAVEVHRSFALDSFEVRLHFGAGMTAGRGLLEAAAAIDTEVTREDKYDQRSRLVGCWLLARTVMDGVPVSAWALASEDDADQLLQATPTDEDTATSEADTAATQPIPTVGTDPAAIVAPAMTAVRTLASVVRPVGDR
ncbi:hypothetical protein ABZZ79_03460 [Streptomyces sp. NPDC006458]|uniref:hypothetical protein n=1 Tax=Streptomyces sp. NPDC006458 TaxID=3154302 RepID=UPI0033BD8E4D